MLKYQNILKGFTKKNCTCINLSKSTKKFSRSSDLSQISAGLPLISKAQKTPFGGFYSALCNISCREAIAQESGNLVGTFEIGPLELGQGVTVGSTLRRALLGLITGSAVTGFKVNDALHEFSVVSNIKEDMLEIASNLKQLRINGGTTNGSILGQVWASGPQIITGGMIQFPKDTVTILSPNQYVCTVATGIARLDVEVSNAAGYKEALAQRIEVNTESSNRMLLPIDANFTPIRTVSYKVKLGHDIYGTLSDIVEFTVTTNGTYTPKRALFEGAKEIMELFYPLILEPKLIEAMPYKN